MNGEVKRTHYASISIGILIILLALSLLLAWVLGDWALFFPILLIAWGGYGLVFGAAVGVFSRTSKAARSASGYYIFWGSLPLLVGLLWFFNRLFPGNVPIIVAIFLVWLALMVIVLARR